jgi:hypothetical protein
MPLSPGDKLGPYEILAPLGAGLSSFFQWRAALPGASMTVYCDPIDRR